MKKLVSILSASLLMVGYLSFASAADQQKEQLAMGTSSSGSSPYVLGASISNIFNKNSKTFNLSAQVTGGYEENFLLIKEKEVDIAQQNLFLFNMAYEGSGRYQDNPQKNIRALFNASLMPVQIVTLKKSGIESYQDLKGKRFNMGEPKQATFDIANIYLETIGFSSKKDIKMGIQSTGHAAGALKDEQQDAIFLLANSPASNIIEVSSEKPVNLIPIEGDIATEFIKNLNDSVVRTVIPAQTYKGQEVDISTVAFPIVLYVDESASEEMVYEFTKVFWEHLPELHESLPATQSLNKEVAIEGIKAPLHPGAVKYFKEAGMMD